MTSKVMYALTLKPGDSVFARCSHCHELNVIFGNPRQEGMSVQFESADQQLDSCCHKCGKFYTWTPSSAIIESSHPD